ncbi:hypothetical protein OBK25_13195 [Empedobacter falsenii]
MKIILNIKFLSLFLFFWLSVSANAQTQKGAGINTDTQEATRSFEIKGNSEGSLRIREMQNVSDNTSYNRVLIANASGDVDYIDLNTLKSQVSVEVIENNRVYYVGTVPVESSYVDAGRFRVYFRPSETAGKHLDIMLKLNQDPISDINIYYTLHRKYNKYNTNLSISQSNQHYYKANQKKYYAGSNSQTGGTNWNVGQMLCPGFDFGDFAEVYFSYPGEPNLYRLNVSARENSSTDKNYMILIEKF